MNQKIYITKDSQIGVIDCPVGPSEKQFSGDQWKENNARQEYESALAKAKEGVVLFKDQDLAYIQMDFPDDFSQEEYLNHKADTLHDIPTGYSVEVSIEQSTSSGDSYFSISNTHFAILKKLPPENREPVCSTCGKPYGAKDTEFCSNSFHLPENSTEEFKVGQMATKGGYLKGKDGKYYTPGITRILHVPMEDFKKFSLLKETPTTATDNTMDTNQTFNCVYCGDLSWTIKKYGMILHKENCPFILHQGNTPNPLYKPQLSANKSAGDKFHIEYSEKDEFEVYEVEKYSTNGSPSVSNCIATCAEEGDALRILKAMQEHASNIAKVEYLLGKTIRYRYIDWDINSYTPWSKCNESDLKKLDDRSIESVEIKW